MADLCNEYILIRVDISLSFFFGGSLVKIFIISAIKSKKINYVTNFYKFCTIFVIQCTKQIIKGG